ncbi:hypothetical protein MAPG_09184 [Magnaporthiopsis poae ATCC 64411]|uniref:Uncharacterized protein n=1 Tax=Magnaporthiopsis poae (strain ATCC 64411 / 73-15) TaxID=644358 RepID=A0A0C4E9A5_MAGP6|nr:hypothetical protein MAPG_09184 [Magnaporthiopsis poae ATCC 64411]
MAATPYTLTAQGQTWKQEGLSFDTKPTLADRLAYQGHKRRLVAVSGWVRAQLADDADLHSLFWGVLRAFAALIVVASLPSLAYLATSSDLPFSLLLNTTLLRSSFRNTCTSAFRIYLHHVPSPMPTVTLQPLSFLHIFTNLPCLSAERCWGIRRQAHYAASRRQKRKPEDGDSDGDVTQADKRVDGHQAARVKKTALWEVEILSWEILCRSSPPGRGDVPAYVKLENDPLLAGGRSPKRVQDHYTTKRRLRSGTPDLTYEEALAQTTPRAGPTTLSNWMGDRGAQAGGLDPRCRSKTDGSGDQLSSRAKAWVAFGNSGPPDKTPWSDFLASGSRRLTPAALVTLPLSPPPTPPHLTPPPTTRYSEMMSGSDRFPNTEMASLPSIAREKKRKR